MMQFPSYLCRIVKICFEVRTFGQKIMASDGYIASLILD
jgi:hypothetical protein